MTSSTPPEAPHYNGKTISPTSPKPIHLPDLQNAPVLQNQNDPIFNLMSTHMASPKPEPELNDGSQIEQSQAATQPAPPAPTQQFVNGDQPQDLLGPESERQRAAVESPGFGALQTQDVVQASASAEDHDLAPSTSHIHVMSSTEDHQQRDQLLNAGVYSIAAQAVGAGGSPTPEQVSAPIEVADKTQDLFASPPQDFNIEPRNIQNLLDNLIAPSHLTVPADPSTAPASEPTSTNPNNATDPADSQTPISALPTPAGLPPRPPPQDGAGKQPDLSSPQTVQAYQNAPGPSVAQALPTMSQASHQQLANYTATNAVGNNGLPPPPSASFEHSGALPETQNELATPQQMPRDVALGPESSAANALNQTSQPLFATEHENAYQDFLREEALYVADGTWDRFPQGSRLFVGNLFTEKVSKKDIWDVFSKYGRLAQISMKNAYGFVQFIDPGSSSRAMLAEEGTELGGRKIHLEISKPQKNTRNSGNAGNRERGGHGRRSRSPDYNRGGQRPVSGHSMYERRGRDDYRPMRSPSPRGLRGYNNRGTDRYYGNRRSRSPSPYGRNGRYRSRSPRGREIDDEASIPIPKRNPVQVPDVQIIIVDESDRTFVAYIQQSFRDHGLRCEVLQLPRGVSLPAVIKRQIIEGVQAVVKIYRKSQVTGKIPLQVFDRSGGGNNVKFDDYEELDAAVAADVVNRAKQLAGAQYPPNQAYGQHGAHIPPMPPPQQQYPPPPVPHNANAALPNAISSLDPETLQKLLGSLQQASSTNPQFQFPQQPGQQTPQDLAALLNSVARQTPQQQQSGYQQPPTPHTPTQGYPAYAKQPQQSPYSPASGGQAPPPSLANNPALAQLLGRFQAGGPGQAVGGGPFQGQQAPGPPVPPPQQQHHQQGQQNVQDIMAQLAKYQR